MPTKLPVNVERIANVLKRTFDGHIDMSDLSGRPAQDVNAAFLARALAAWCLTFIAGTDPGTAGGAVTDGFQDNGIDSLYFDQPSNTLLFVQSTFSQDGSHPINGHATAEFVDGVRALLSEKLDRFNAKFQKRKAEILAALYQPIKIILVTAHTSLNPLSAPVQQKIGDLISELNASEPTAQAVYIDQAALYRAVLSASAQVKVTLNVPLINYSTIDKPFLAYYGRVHVLEVAKWWRDYGKNLCSRNLRHLLISSEVNAALEQTLRNEPDNFWYFNNGITIICESIGKAIVGAPAQQLGLFQCQGASIVNGAQTVGTIGSTLSALLAESQKAGGQEQEAQHGWVQVRLIDLAKCPPDFGLFVTRATNFQNAVSYRDLAALDRTQQRLAIEFALDQRTYAYKSGEADPHGEQGCSITEATQALACAQHKIDLAVQVKREIGEIWRDTTKAPYTDLFNDGLTTQTVWRSVLVMRAVEDEIQNLRHSSLSRADMLGIHMHRVILHIVFRDPEVKPLNHDDNDQGKLLAKVREISPRVFKQVADYVETQHPNEYLASLCKNGQKCSALAVALLGNEQGVLFASEIGSKNEAP